MPLTGKVAIVTGGNSGIGQAIVLELARRHANIVIDYVCNPEATEALEREVARLGDQSIGVEADVSKISDLETALAHVRRGFEMFDPNMQFPDWPGSHPGVQYRFYVALISWMLGYPDRSIDELRAAVRSAETLGHPFTLAQTLCLAAFVHIFRHEPAAAADCAVRALVAQDLGLVLQTDAQLATGKPKRRLHRSPPGWRRSKKPGERRSKRSSIGSGARPCSPPPGR